MTALQQEWIWGGLLLFVAGPQYAIWVWGHLNSFKTKFWLSLFQGTIAGGMVVVPVMFG